MPSVTSSPLTKHVMIDETVLPTLGQSLKHSLPDPNATLDEATVPALLNAQQELIANPKAVRYLIRNGASIGEVIAKLTPGGEAECWLYEAWIWELLTDGFSQIDLLPGEHIHLAPLLARRRFEHLAKVAGGESLKLRGGISDARDRLTGKNSPAGYEAAFSEARQAWATNLLTYQSHIALQDSIADLETEVCQVIFRNHERPSDGLLTARRSPDRADLALATHLYESLLLPRFDLRTGQTLSGLAATINARQRSHGPVHRRWRIALPASLALVSIGLWCVPWAFTGLVAVIAGVLALGLVIGFASRGGRLEASTWLLRLPASTVVGLFLLLSFGSDWLKAASTNCSYTLLAILGLLLASFAYLLIEVRNHGVACKPSLTRSGVVLVVGLGYSTVISTIGLMGLAPAIIDFGSQGYILATGGWARGLCLATATALNLTFGVFSQILWDDKSITAPLAHSTWTTR